MSALTFNLILDTEIEPFLIFLFGLCLSATLRSVAIAHFALPLESNERSGAAEL